MIPNDNYNLATNYGLYRLVDPKVKGWTKIDTIRTVKDKSFEEPIWVHGDKEMGKKLIGDWNKMGVAKWKIVGT